MWYTSVEASKKFNLNLILRAARQPLHWLSGKWSGDDNTASERKAGQSGDKNGEVFLIGAGPGDAELLTLKAWRVLQQVDVVMYDWLVNPDVMNMIPAHIERIFVGKKCGQHSMKQADICELMVQVAQSGRSIARLKGGDPAIFARAGEECEELTKHNVPFAIIPGITAASGGSAYAGIPLTHRDCAQSVRFITAHLKDPVKQPDWQQFAPKSGQRSQETLVFYMGLGRLKSIMEKLVEHNMPADTPVAVIDQATSAQQQVCIGTMLDIAAKAEGQLQGPAIIVVGEVVNKRNPVSTAMLKSDHLTINPVHA